MAECEITKLIPGPKGDAGTNGSNGTNGLDAFTTLLANFTMPAVGASAIANVGSSAWITVGQALYVQFLGVLYVTALPDSTHATLQNNAAETGNAAPGTVAPIAGKVSPAGFKGVAGSAGGAGTGVTVATKGDLQTYAGAPANLPVGTNGQLLRALSTAGTGLDWEQIVPNATGVGDDNKIAIANCPVGTETPANIQFTLAKVTDTGAYQTVGGNARGVDAVDQQAARAANAQVASGNNSTIAGGRNNTASAQGSTVGGGEGNTASGADSTVAGGENNIASGQDAVVGGGFFNVASGQRSAVAAGKNNVSSAVNSCIAAGNDNQATSNSSFVGGGSGNIASSSDAAVSGGSGNTASGAESCVGAGIRNTASGDNSFIGGGSDNLASGKNSSVPSGFWGVADKYGQVTHAAGRFAAAGDAQCSELLWRISTTDATANVEMFLDAAGTQRASVPNNTTWAFHIIGVARRDNGTSITFEVKGGIKNDAGNCVLLAAVTAAVIADGTGGALAIGNFTVDADNAADSLRIRVTGIAGQNFRWVAHARLVECGF